jgi:hypothetical protein
LRRLLERMQSEYTRNEGNPLTLDARTMSTSRRAIVTSNEKKKGRLKVLRFAAQKNGQILGEGTCLFVFCVILMSRFEDRPFQNGLGFLRLNAPATVRLNATLLPYLGLADRHEQRGRGPWREGTAKATTSFRFIRLLSQDRKVPDRRIVSRTVVVAGGDGKVVTP